MENRTYLCIDLKSFYASVECVERGLDPLTTNLVVADCSRTEKTICLAVSPALKTFGIPGRPRLFEVIQQVKKINYERRKTAFMHVLSGKSCNINELAENPDLELDYIIATPQMAHYMKFSTDIYKIYLKYIAPEDIHVYSIDEVFMDLTNYLEVSEKTPHEFARMIINDVLKTTGITATAGIGTNMYLAKIAMDIVAKHIPADKDGVRIAEIDEMKYRQKLWNHQPITDFWRVGKGYAKKLAQHGMYTMGDVARCSIGKPEDYLNEELLYKLFGVNAELLIDHAWGWEPCTIAEIKKYTPGSTSLGSGQVLQSAYTAEKARIVVHEMAESLALNLLDKGLVTDQMVLTIGYDIENLTNPEISSKYRGDITTDMYGRKVPKHAHGTANMERPNSSNMLITEAVMELFDRIVDRNLLIRRLNLTAARVIRECDAEKNLIPLQLSWFTDYEALEKKHNQEEEDLKKEKKIQLAILSIKKKFGSNAILKGMNLQEGATAKDRNEQIGGHKA